MPKETLRKKLEIRKCEKFRRSGLVDENWYLENYEDLKGSSVDPVVHYCLFGWKEGRNPNPYFDTKWFSNKYRLGAEFPLKFYLKNWKKKSLNPSYNFDNKKYLYSNVDVLNAGVEPLSHYLKYGRYEGRQIFSLNEVSVKKELQKHNSTGLFISDWYEAVNEDLRGSNINFLEHYVCFGEGEGRNPNPFFDVKWYRKKYAEEIGEESPLLFYAHKGWKMGHSPSLNFDAEAYTEEFLDGLEEEPLQHYLEKGKALGYSPKPLNSTRFSSGGLLKFNPESQLTKDPSLRALIDNVPVELSPEHSSYSDELNIHWVMPDFAPGAGGHMTIFRTIRFLEIFGHKNTIWIYAPTLHESEEEAYQDIIQHFQLVKAEVKFTSDIDFLQASGDVIFATDWGSVSFVNSVSNFKRRFYFVQDHEPEFYAQGSHAILARNTYSYDLDCVCASPWLKKLMSEKYGRWAREFWLSVDFDTYSLPTFFENGHDSVVKIAFYARHFTSRRAVELGFLALEELATKVSNIEIHTFGAPLPFTSAPFKCIDHGICNTKELADLYRECDIGVVFSATNYSLIPQEMMACGLPVAELDVDSTRAIFPEGVVTYLPTDPRMMASTLADMVSNKDARKIQAEKAYDWVSQFTWKDAAKSVEASIFERLNEVGFTRVKTIKNETIKASVIIPTWNAGEVFKKVIHRLQEQIAPWNYEVLVVDSGSTDGTVEFVQSNPDIHLHQIPNSEFQHGKTRNLAISLTQGEYIAVLTQDALPVDEYWLYNMVCSLEHFPKAAGAFGKHFAWPEADPYTKRDLEQHFDGFEQHPYCVSQFTDQAKWNHGDIGWRQFLHFYSDNNSIMRRNVWKDIPYPEVKFGEDQAWALAIIEAGYQKVYCKQGAVYHSHDFDEGDVQKRAYEEAEFFKTEFGYTMVKSGNAEKTIKDINKEDLKWGKERNLSASLIERRLKFNRAKILGFEQANNI